MLSLPGPHPHSSVRVPPQKYRPLRFFRRSFFPRWSRRGALSSFAVFFRLTYFITFSLSLLSFSLLSLCTFFPSLSAMSSENKDIAYCEAWTRERESYCTGDRCLLTVLPQLSTLWYYQRRISSAPLCSCPAAEYRVLLFRSRVGAGAVNRWLVPCVCFSVFRGAGAWEVAKAIYNKFGFPSWACAAGFNNNNNNYGSMKVIWHTVTYVICFLQVFCNHVHAWMP